MTRSTQYFVRGHRLPPAVAFEIERVGFRMFARGLLINFDERRRLVRRERNALSFDVI